MKTKTFSNTAHKFKALQSFAITMANCSQDDIKKALLQLSNNALFQSKGWQDNFKKLSNVVNNGTIEYSIFALNGNKKLPFVSFSTVPAVTCPGAGECLNFCYSFSAWRYPAAVMRQLQNLYLMRFNQDAIVYQFESVASVLGSFDFRLYVDGDFASVSDVQFWFQLLNRFPTVRAYGYSKSFAELLAYDGPMPTNYQLNISSGHCHNDDVVQKVKALPITRGEFIAVNIGRKVKSSEHGTIQVNAKLRQAFKQKAFLCGGKCGSCTGKGHACGLPQLKGLPIIIAVH